MATTTTRGRVRTINTPTPTSNISMNAQTLAAALSDFDIHIYGAGGTPLYDMIATYGYVTVSNTLDTAFQSFDDMRAGLGEGEAGFIYSEEYDRFTLAIKLPSGGVVFAGLLHDKGGSPRVEAELTLCRVVANRDLEQSGETIVTKGQEFLKAFPRDYAVKLIKAA